LRSVAAAAAAAAVAGAAAKRHEPYGELKLRVCHWLLTCFCRQKEDPTQMVAKQQAASQPLPPPSAEFAMFQCPLCKGYLKDAVIIPCCQLSFCDTCIRDKLVPEDNFQCPNCRASPISPDTLIPNRCVRASVAKLLPLLLLCLACNAPWWIG
jgi:hypothetical protein